MNIWKHFSKIFSWVQLQFANKKWNECVDRNVNYEIHQLYLASWTMFIDSTSTLKFISVTNVNHDICKIFFTDFKYKFSNQGVSFRTSNIFTCFSISGKWKENCYKVVNTWLPAAYNKTVDESCGKGGSFFSRLAAEVLNKSYDNLKSLTMKRNLIKPASSCFLLNIASCIKKQEPVKRNFSSRTPLWESINTLRKGYSD